MRRRGRSAIALIRAYQGVVSPLLGARCRYHPSCSDYAAQAIDRYGALRGIYLGGRRIVRCHPWRSGGLDPVPESFSFRIGKARVST